MRPIVIDSGDAKSALATRLGAEVFLDFKQETDIASRIKEIADGLGANGVVVTAWQTYKGMSAVSSPVFSAKVSIQMPWATLVIESVARSYALDYLQLRRTSSLARLQCCLPSRS